MKKISRIYLAVIAACFIFLLVVGVAFKIEVYEKEPIHSKVTRLYSQVFYDSEQIMRLQVTLPRNDSGDLTAALFTLHQNVTIYIENEKIYEFYVGSNLFGHSPGIAWNIVTIKPEQMGKQVEIILESPYSQTADVVPDIYLGTQSGILTTLIKRDIPGIIICGLTFLIGGFLLVYWFVVKTKANLASSMLYLGLFAVFMGVWSLNELSITPLLAGNNQVTIYLSYISLMLMMVPFILFMKGLFLQKDHPVWYFCCILSLTDIIVCVLLQVFNLVDFRQSLWITHLTFLIFILITLVMIALEIKQGHLSLEMKANICCLIIVFTGFMANLYMYYLKQGGSNVIGRICFLIYICVLGYVSTRDTAELLEKGKEAEIYRRLAFVDVLTGVYNRTAYSQNASAYTAGEIENVQVFILDLNNLKWCNDNLGHMAGDNYIIRSSTVICAAFPPAAQIYRIGGDEFCVLACDMSEEEIAACIRQIAVPIQVNIEGKMFLGRISYGFGAYQEGDADIYAIVRRADKAMYQCKKKIKKGEQ